MEILILVELGNLFLTLCQLLHLEQWDTATCGGRDDHFLMSSLASTKRHLTQRLENLDVKMDEQKEMSKLIMNEVGEVKLDLFQVGFDIETIQKMVTGLEGKIGLIESKQDVTNSGLWYLCQFAGGIKEGLNAKLFQDTSVKPPLEHASATYEDTSLKGVDPRGVQLLHFESKALALQWP
ncbi:hypothetical protein NE237_001796 [Protea cynaroides]|uniref:DUF1664 domain-containing protein n=1 Tax=Protea cynaroides TaxID=273540 RepID=A0A9Q0QYF7_9MAGN|nr:hypothetical protein NE237_001796 [Protea cynaroides]